ncbi:conserved hypothetical protein [Leishmania mexicana MHOM/GT/2001/U1103]|uniref:Uncharacterized protein n=1 Tax=Leishmania mexicana (strain MHOM/GT/2001/U1103) TaxID=929439 RepID=E9AX86_LEIMU|nr:conserved hypothetical protein [Leishmania mexicana MHOM/GT/2001/U1103]CBZ27577.1 conserved hypothetical protein [Leishmania mexicana MHOM/GT/2001/U1103]
MPASAVARMRARSRQNQERLTEDEKLRRREERENKKSVVPQWLVWSMIVIVVGSSLVNLYFSVTQSPKMAD